MLQECYLTDALIAPVWTCQLVTHLTLSDNKFLKVLPDLNLPVLEHLDISNNRIAHLSTELLLPKLKNLDLSVNNLRDVAAALTKLCGRASALQKIGLKGNQELSLPPSQIIDRGAEEVCQFFRDLKHGQKICWRQTVLVVGQEEAGKTALCHAFLGHACTDHGQMTEASTVGIDTVSWPTVVAISNTRSVPESSIGSGLR